MHVPDGFLNPAVCAASGIVATAAVGLALERSRLEVASVRPARVGVVAGFVFAAQMVNFPVGSDTSGHLLGGVLAALLVGPWTAIVVLTCVLLVQALLFADGGVSALGANILLLAVVPALVAGSCWLLVRRRPRLGAALASFVAVPAAAVVFAGLYALGGQVPISLGRLTAMMVGIHAIIGVGEAIITTAVLAGILAGRPDLVYATQIGRPAPMADGNRPVVRVAAPRPPSQTKALALTLLVSAVVAGGLSLLASSAPDGLESVAGQLGFDQAAGAANAPLAEYSFVGAGVWGGVWADRRPGDPAAGRRRGGGAAPAGVAGAAPLVIDQFLASTSAT